MPRISPLARLCFAVLLAGASVDELKAQRLAFYPADAARGAGLAAACLACHGQPDMPSGTSPSFRVPLLAGQRGEVIFRALLDYQRGARRSPIMAPLVQNLSIQDMRDLGAFLSVSGPYVPETVDQGSWAHEKVHRDCTLCHGESGMGVMAGVPVLTGQHEDYLDRDGSRDDPAMTQIAESLTPDEIRQLAAYFAKQTHLETSSAR